MNKIILKRTLEGLVGTAKEKICVFGVEDAQEQLKKIRDVYIDMVYFWNLDEELEIFIPKGYNGWIEYFDDITNGAGVER